MLFFFAPLAQFELYNLPPSCSFDIIYPLEGLTIMDSQMLQLFGFIIFPLLLVMYQSQTDQQVSLSFKHETLMSDLVSRRNFNYISISSTIFVFIFSCNFVGMLPYTQTLTSQLLITLLLSFIVMFTIWLHSMLDNKISLLNHFLPNGAPLLLIPFIILIELISNLSRLISLSVRLFANMTSGHALLKILAGFGIGALSLISVWKLFIIFPILIIFIITILELIIAFLQTYVFMTLLLIYIAEQE